MVDAAESLPGTDPDRCGFTIAFQTARDQVIQAVGIVTANFNEAGLIGRRVLAGLLPPRRQRVSTRKVKSPISRYSERQDDGRPDTSSTVTDLDITVLEPPESQPVLPTRSRDDRHTAPTQRRRHRILTLLQEDPTRLWRPRDIAAHFGDAPCTPCIDSSPDGPRPDSSTRSAPASTPPQHGPQLPLHDLRKR